MKLISMTPDLYHYVSQHQTLLHPILPELQAETSRRTDAGMQISPEQGVFMHTLAKLIGAKRILEIGCFTGYSSICLGLALPEDGQIISCDVDEETTEVARRYQRLAGLGQKARIILGPATDTLGDLEQQYGTGSFDLIFIDADKENYEVYYEKSIALLRPNGALLVDNVLWSGHVVDPSDVSATTLAIRRLNERIRLDQRVDSNLRPIADGIFLVRKR